MFVEGRIETTNLQEIAVLQVTFGLDTAEKRRLLDQRTTFQTKCQVASKIKAPVFLATWSKNLYTQPMSALYSDTHPKMEALQIELWRQASATRKMNMLAQLNAAARTLALTGLRSQYPQASEAELRRRLADLLLGEELARKVYGEIYDAK
jgi:hypothetical protein